MADSSINNLTSLARALSQPKLDLVEVTDVCPPRSVQLHPCRRRKLSSCNSVESVEPVTSPSAAAAAAEARVLVINTGGTIGMTLHDNGIYTEPTHCAVIFLTCALGRLQGGSLLAQQVACC